MSSCFHSAMETKRFSLSCCSAKESEREGFPGGKYRGHQSVSEQKGEHKAQGWEGCFPITDLTLLLLNPSHDLFSAFEGFIWVPLSFSSVSQLRQGRPCTRAVQKVSSDVIGKIQTFIAEGTGYKKHFMEDNDASVPFKVGTLGPHMVLPMAISCPVVSEISTASKVILLLGKTRSHGAPTKSGL